MIIKSIIAVWLIGALAVLAYLKFYGDKDE